MNIKTPIYCVTIVRNDPQYAEFHVKAKNMKVAIKKAERRLKKDFDELYSITNITKTKE